MREGGCRLEEIGGREVGYKAVLEVALRNGDSAQVLCGIEFCVYYTGTAMTVMVLMSIF
jgi:hypothetical protein